MKHTPGPWKLGEEATVECTGGFICVCGDPFERGIGEDHANAKLIAQAPDLYELLKEIVGDVVNNTAPKIETVNRAASVLARVDRSSKPSKKMKVCPKCGSFGTSDHIKNCKP